MVERFWYDLNVSCKATTWVSVNGAVGFEVKSMDYSGYEWIGCEQG